ncbi:alcohol dehydrogenase, propanol-preferring [Actinacidiphila yanglinensis]|uniref:alcohol dehydrogenase n=1 Tax=Actinacidiphila yanglinensis TaxID=310779 RepID=A0A1H6C4R7_9ACTN|nr:NAD(P)-dependent alcohol dehydrogenase [Actinacidiphila yanglinensis]SEG67893.1 alcohol dehydrogenase, propanol-preferring [Actinacidiphila yanglinensis]
MHMQAARMHGYNEPLRIEEVPVPDPAADEILLKVAATGICRSDYQLQDGYFKGPFPVDFPYIPGHEVTGRVAGLGSGVPKTVGYTEGDMVVVNPSWGDGTCRQCREGNEHLCSGNGRWVGFGPPGGFAEYMAVQYRHVIPVSKEAAKKPELLAPMTDAGMTPYRGMRKLRDAGKLGPGRTVAVTGIGGLGSYAVQYAKLLGSGAVVVALARSDRKLEVAKDNGADHGINVRDKSTEAIQDELERHTGRRTLDAVLDCVGSEQSISMDFALLGPEGAVAAVGLMSDHVEHRQFPFVGMELSYLGSFWGNHLDLVEVLSLAERGLVKHNVTKVDLADINENLESLGHGDVVGRQVLVFA